MRNLRQHLAETTSAAATAKSDTFLLATRIHLGGRRSLLAGVILDPTEAQTLTLQRATQRERTALAFAAAAKRERERCCSLFPQGLLA
jgi:hypothetical protein